MDRRSARPGPRQKVRRDVDLTRVLVAVVLVLGVLGLAYLGVVYSIARQGLDVRHLVDISLGPKEWGTLGGFVVGLGAFLAVLKRTSKTEKLVGYDVPHGVSEAIRSELAAHAAAAAAERDRHHREALEEGRQHHAKAMQLAREQHAELMGLVADVGAEVVKVHPVLTAVLEDCDDQTDGLERLVDLLQESQVQVTFGNPERLQRAPEPAPEPVVDHDLELEQPVSRAGLEPVGGQRVDADRVWGPGGPPRLRAPGERRAHRVETGLLPVVPAVPAPAAVPVLEVTERVERHAETLPPVPPLPAARTRPWGDLAALTAAAPSTGVRQALTRVEAGVEDFDDLMAGREYRPHR